MNNETIFRLPWLLRTNLANNMGHGTSPFSLQSKFGIPFFATQLLTCPYLGLLSFW